MKRVGKLFLQIFLGCLISIVLHKGTGYPLGKIFLIIGVLYFLFGAFGLIDLISSNGVANFFSRDKDQMTRDSIGKITDSSSSDEVFSRFFPKKEKSSSDVLIQILAGFFIITLEYFVK